MKYSIFTVISEKSLFAPISAKKNIAKGREALFLHCPHRESNPGLLSGSPLHYCCATPAP